MERSAGSKRRYFRVITFLVLVIGIANGCSKADDPSDGNGGNNGGNDQPGANEVWIKGMAYEPSTITITAGTTIKWTNKDDVVHTVTSDNGLFDSGNITSSNTFIAMAVKQAQAGQKSTVRGICSIRMGLCLPDGKRPTVINIIWAKTGKCVPVGLR